MFAKQFIHCTHECHVWTASGHLPYCQGTRSVLCGNLESWDEDRIYVYIELIHFIVEQKLTQHCKVTIPQFKKKRFEEFSKTMKPFSCILDTMVNPCKLSFVHFILQIKWLLDTVTYEINGVLIVEATQLFILPKSENDLHLCHKNTKLPPSLSQPLVSPPWSK